MIRYNDAASIIDKIREKTSRCFSSIVSTRNPFGFPSSERGKRKPFDDCLSLYSSEGISYVHKTDVKAGFGFVDKYKIMESTLTAEHANEPDSSGRFKVLSTLKLLQPNEVCTDSYLVLGPFSTKEEADNCLTFLKTKLVRFLLLMSVSSIHITRDTYNFVPLVPFDHPWDDNQLISLFSLNEEEITFINNLIREY